MSNYRRYDHRYAAGRHVSTYSTLYNKAAALPSRRPLHCSITNYPHGNRYPAQTRPSLSYQSQPYGTTSTGYWSESHTYKTTTVSPRYLSSVCVPDAKEDTWMLPSKTTKEDNWQLPSKTTKEDTSWMLPSKTADEDTRKLRSKTADEDTRKLPSKTTKESNWKLPPTTQAPPSTPVICPPIGRPACIEDVNLLIDENSVDHHTDRYEMCMDGYIDDITQRCTPAQLIVRRGQEFKVRVHLNQDYNSRKDQIRIVATIGEMPRLSKGTAAELVTGERRAEEQWFAIVTGFWAREVDISIYSPPTSAVGKWQLAFDTIQTGDDGFVSTLMNDVVVKHVYILFNAWCEDDAVYMEQPSWREEYVLNDSGKLYRGGARQIHEMPWNFGQFESVALQTALYLLDERSTIFATSSGCPITISRALSALVNFNEDNGILMGNWSNDYRGGVSPTCWTGSVAILQRYMDSGRPVRYGQCWVFSGVMTTVCRALGIPTRSITNFDSAHDTDGSLTIDRHFNENFEPEGDKNMDSIWNFHVWNECWMTRPDLPFGYGGWQVVDSTPQEMSGGLHRAGPASVVGIKNGDVGMSYDAKFIFAEVNADRVNWFRQPNGRYQIYLEKDVVGRNISTKAIGPCKGISASGYDREDITHQYKYPEGSQSERTAVWKAARWSTKPQVYFDEEVEQDVVFGLQVLDSTPLVGSDFEVETYLRNKSCSRRTVHLTITLSSVYYTGVYRRKLRRETFKCVLPPKSEETRVIIVCAEDYIDDLVDYGYAMKVDYMGSVLETKQLLATQETFTLSTVVPEVVVPQLPVCIGDNLHTKVKFQNPLKKPLTGCSFTFESAGNLKPTTVNISDVSAEGIVEATYDFAAKRAGDCVIITSFECNQLGDLQGQGTASVYK